MRIHRNAFGESTCLGNRTFSMVSFQLVLSCTFYSNFNQISSHFFFTTRKFSLFSGGRCTMRKNKTLDFYSIEWILLSSPHAKRRRKPHSNDFNDTLNIHDENINKNLLTAIFQLLPTQKLREKDFRLLSNYLRRIHFRLAPKTQTNFGVKVFN